jgi:hypothetical protein
MSLLDTTMELAKLAGTVANPELVQEALKANKEALDLSRENLELQKRIMALETQVKELLADQSLSKSLFRNGDYVYKDGDPTAFCPLCWDAHRKLIHLHIIAFKGVHCPDCKTQYDQSHKQNPGRDAPGSIPV